MPNDQGLPADSELKIIFKRDFVSSDSVRIEEISQFTCLILLHLLML